MILHSFFASPQPPISGDVLQFPPEKIWENPGGSSHFPSEKHGKNRKDVEYSWKIGGFPIPIPSPSHPHPIAIPDRAARVPRHRALSRLPQPAGADRGGRADVATAADLGAQQLVRDHLVGDAVGPRGARSRPWRPWRRVAVHHGKKWELGRHGNFWANHQHPNFWD